MTAQLLRDVPHAVYHADAFDGPPRFSRSTAVTMLQRSPLAAWAEHPRLGNRSIDRHTKASIMGTLMHGMLLGGGPEAEIIIIHGDRKKGEPRELPATNYKRKEAQELKAAALEAGRLPVLLRELEAAKEAAVATFERLQGLGYALDEFQREVTLLWEEEEVACKARMDAVSIERRLVLDPKFPEQLNVWRAEKAVKFHPAFQMQAWAYTNALNLAFPGEPFEMLYAVGEWTYPYDVALIPAGKSVLEAGRLRWEQQREIWKQCLASGKEWPGVGRRASVEIPPEAVLDAAGLDVNERLDAIFGEEEFHVE